MLSSKATRTRLRGARRKRAITSQPASARASRGLPPALLNALGIALIVGVFALTLPLVVPQMLGYQVFDIVSGSMEPAIPVGSVIYVADADPFDIQTDEVIAFYDRGTVVAHRVVGNRTSLGEFVTKGDANNTEDLAPIPYDQLIGRVMLSVPYVGAAMALYTSTVGKVYLLLTLGIGIMLNLLADRMRRQRSAEALRRLQAERAEARVAVGEQTGESGAAGEPVEAEDAQPARAPRSGGWVRTLLMVLLALVFCGAGGVVFYVRSQQEASAQAYAVAAEAYTRLRAEQEAQALPVPPIEVDFAALTAQNPDIVGWIYCEGTNIDYPVLYGESNSQYLRHDYLGEYNINGSIFVDADNSPDFSDANTIVYGHNMASAGTMFAGLDSWESQVYYDEHPVMWLLTPTQNYQVQLVAGRHVDAHGSMYEIMAEHDARFASYLADALAESDFVADPSFSTDPQANYLMLTTCAYIFDNARYNLVGRLVPAA